jgi:hypothetical protein
MGKYSTNPVDPGFEKCGVNPNSFSGRIFRPWSDAGAGGSIAAPAVLDCLQESAEFLKTLSEVP